MFLGAKKNHQGVRLPKVLLVAGFFSVNCSRGGGSGGGDVTNLRTAPATAPTAKPSVKPPTPSPSTSPSPAPVITATITGVPANVGAGVNLTLGIAGSLVTAFKYKIGADGVIDCTNGDGYSSALTATDGLTVDPSALADGLLRVCVTGVDAAGDSQAAALATSVTVLKDTLPPAAFNISAPTARQIFSSTTPTIVWDPATDENPVTYHLVIATSADCAQVTQDYPGLTAATQILTALTDASKYFVCVTATDIAGNTKGATNNGVAFFVATPGSGFLAPPGDPTGLVASTSDWMNITATWAAPAAAANQQQLLFYGGDNSSCTGDGEATINVGSAAVATLDLPRFSGTLMGTLRFKVRAQYNYGEAVDSACSGQVSLANDAVAVAGTLPGMNLGKSATVSYDKVSGGAGVDIIVADPSYSSNTGFIAVISAGSTPGAQSIRVYTGDNAGDKLGLNLQLIDVSGDGVKDIVSANAAAAPGGMTGAGSIYVIPGGTALPASGSVGSVAQRYNGDTIGDQLGLNTGTTKLQFVDVTGDGKKDIIATNPAANSGAGSIYVIPGGSTAAVNGPIHTAGRRYDGAAADGLGTLIQFADLNGDGITDIVTSSTGSSSNSFTGNGSITIILGAATLPASGLATAVGRVYAGTASAEGFGWDSVAKVFFADLNGDGITDLVAVNAANSEIFVLLGAASLPASGDAPTAGRLYTPSAAPTLVPGILVQDINGDGKADIVVADGTQGSGVSMYLLYGRTAMPASGSFVSVASHTYSGLHTSPKFYAKDLDGDGKPELVVADTQASVNFKQYCGSIFILSAKPTFPNDDLIANAVSQNPSNRRYDGENAFDYLGANIAFAKFKGSNYFDLVDLNPSTMPNGHVNAGSMFAVLGGATLPASGYISSAGLRIDGDAAQDRFADPTATQFVPVPGGVGFNMVSVNTAWQSSKGAIFVIPGGAQLANASGTVSAGGYKYVGDNANDMLGTNLQFANLNGANAPTMVSVNPASSPGAVSGAGSLYFVGWPLPASDKISIAGKRLDGTVANQALGKDTAFGDINGDGSTDMLVGQNPVGTSGMLQAVYGRTNVAAFTLTTLAATAVDAAPDIGGNVGLIDFFGDGLLDVVSFAATDTSAPLLGGVAGAGAAVVLPNQYVVRP